MLPPTLHPCLSSADSSSSRVMLPEPEVFMALNMARMPTRYSASRLRIVRRNACVVVHAICDRALEQCNLLMHSSVCAFV